MMMCIHKQVIAAALFALLLYTGVLPPVRKYRPVSLLPLTSVTQLTGTVLTTPARTAAGSYRCTVALESVTGKCGSYTVESEARGRITVFIPARIYEARLPGKLYSRARVKQAPLIDSGITLNFTGSVSTKMRDAAFIADTAAYPPARTEALSLRVRVAQVRAQCRLACKRILYAWGDAGGLFLALVSGAAEYVDTDVAQAFKQAGLAHVLALSGMHLSVFSGFSRRLSRKGGKHISEVASFLLVTLFVWFAGFSPSLKRAFIGFSLAAAGRLCGKRVAMLGNLAACFCIHVVIAPEEAATLSFMLSYGGLAGILVAGEAVRLFLCRLRCLNLLPPTIAADFSASVGATLATTPVSIRFWGYCTPGAILSSTVVSPLASLFLVTGIVCFALSLALPFLLFPLGAIMRLLYRVITVLVSAFAAIPAVTV